MYMDCVLSPSPAPVISSPMHGDCYSFFCFAGVCSNKRPTATKTFKIHPCLSSYSTKQNGLSHSPQCR